MVLEVGDELLVIDCGVTFPRSNLGIDIYHPDFSWLERNKKRITGLVLTHGHEDHIGALPFFLDRFPEVPVWGPKYALELGRQRLAEYSIDDRSVDLREARPKGRFAVGSFEIEPVRVSHSIVDALAFVVRSKAGTVVHTGDFKFEESDNNDELTDEARFREVGDEGVRLLLSDSTNIDSHGKSQSEIVAASVLKELVDSAPGRVVVGMFASNIPRLRALGQLALETGRKILLLGRSVQTHVRLATELKKLDWPSDLMVDPTTANSTPRRNLLAVASGTQAERQAALWRLGIRQHPLLTLDEGDRVIMSSRVIPGNDPAVTEMLGNFLRLGVEVRNPTTDPGVHVSGHAYRDEQSRMIDLVKPQAFVPVHGTTLHLHHHAALARSKGVSEVVVLENGDVGELSDDTNLRRVLESVPWGKIATWDGEAIPERVLADREAIGRSGIAFVTVLVSGRGRPVAPASVATRGVVDEANRSDVLRDTARDVTKALHDQPWSMERPSDEAVADLVRQVARRSLERAVGKKPVTVAQVVRVKG